MVVNNTTILKDKISNIKSTKICHLASLEWILSITDLHACKWWFPSQTHNMLSTKYLICSSYFKNLSNYSLDFFQWLLQESTNLEVTSWVSIWLFVNEILKTALPTMYLWTKSCLNLRTLDIKVGWTKGIDNKRHKRMENFYGEEGWKCSLSMTDCESNI